MRLIYFKYLFSSISESCLNSVNQTTLVSPLQSLLSLTEALKIVQVSYMAPGSLTEA